MIVEWSVPAKDDLIAIADYIASMTDRLALLEHKALFDTYQVMR